MILNPMKWKTRTLAYALVCLLGSYFICVYKWSHNFTYVATIKNTNPQHVWEFVADFSNMLKLNPTLENFNIIHESGNYEHWKYSVQYTEHLSHLPIIQNTAHGHFSIKPKAKGYVIESNHRTCFFMGISCLNSDSEFIFEPHGQQDTKCTENIRYECPLIFSSLCRKEVLFQRQEIMQNLQQHFQTTGN